MRPPRGVGDALALAVGLAAFTNSALESDRSVFSCELLGFGFRSIRSWISCTRVSGSAVGSWPRWRPALLDGLGRALAAPLGPVGLERFEIGAHGAPFVATGGQGLLCSSDIVRLAAASRGMSITMA